jgi:hypothetical protein
MSEGRATYKQAKKARRVIGGDGNQKLAPNNNKKKPI